MDQNKDYKTNSFYLAAFLLAKDVPIIGIEKTSSSKAEFIFPNSEQTQSLVRVFYFSDENQGDLFVHFRKVQNSIKQLKSLIYD